MHTIKKHILFILIFLSLCSISFAGPWGTGGGSGTPEGTAVLSTGEAAGNKFLREDGDGTCSWQTLVGGGDLLADGSVPLTSNWDVGAFAITALQLHSDIVTGTAPFTVASTTVVANLQSATVATITGLAPDTATTQATQASITTLANVVTVGALNAGSITSGFGAIDNGASDITTTGTGTFGNVVTGATATPTLDFDDTNSLDADKTIAQIFSDATTVTAGAVVSDTTFAHKDGGDASGAFTTWLKHTGATNVAAFTATTTFQAGDIVAAELDAGAKFIAYAVADLSDTTTPSVLTIAETSNSVISNYKASGADHVFTMPAAHIGGNVIFPIGDEFQVDVEPDSGANFFLNGTAMATDEHIQNVADTLGEQMVGYVANINGTLTWMFESKYANFAEATP